MWQIISHVLADWAFWARVGGALLIWYLLALWMARAFLSNGATPVHAAKAGPFWAAPLTAVIAGIGSWFWWHSEQLSVLLAVTALIIPLIFMLVLTSLSREA